MALLTKFPLTDHHFLSVGLNGYQPEIRITGRGQSTLRLTTAELDILNKESVSILQKDIQLSSSESSYGGNVYRMCSPDISTGGIRFTIMHMPDSQPEDHNDFVFPQYTLGKSSALTLVRLLPRIMNAVQVIIDEEPNIALAYGVIRDQIKRLTQLQEPSIENFHYTMRLLHLYIPNSFLIAAFKDRCKGTVLNVRDLIQNVISQFDYIYTNIYSQ